MKGKFGIIKLIAAMIAGAVASPKGATKEGLMQQRNTLLTNGYQEPKPHNYRNQRQKRKQRRQQPHGWK